MPFITFNLNRKNKTIKEQAFEIVYVLDVLSKQGYKQVGITCPVFEEQRVALEKHLEAEKDYSIGAFKGADPVTMEKCLTLDGYYANGSLKRFSPGLQTSVLIEVLRLLRLAKYRHLSDFFRILPITINPPEQLPNEQKAGGKQVNTDIESIRNHARQDEYCVLGWANESCTQEKPFAIEEEESKLTLEQNQEMQRVLQACAQSFKPSKALQDILKESKDQELKRLADLIVVLNLELKANFCMHRNRKLIKYSVLTQLQSILSDHEILENFENMSRCDFSLTNPTRLIDAINRVVNCPLKQNKTKLSFDQVKTNLYAGFSSRTATFLNSVVPKELVVDKSQELAIRNESKKQKLACLQNLVDVLGREDNSWWRMNTIRKHIKLTVLQYLLELANQNYIASTSLNAPEEIAYKPLIKPEDVSQAIHNIRKLNSNTNTFDSLKTELYSGFSCCFFTNRTERFLKSINISKELVVDHEEQSVYKQLKI